MADIQIDRLRQTERQVDAVLEMGRYAPGILLAYQHFLHVAVTSTSQRSLICREVQLTGRYNYQSSYQKGFL